MYSQQRTKAPSSASIRKTSPKAINRCGKQGPTLPPFTQENWNHLVRIVMTLVQERNVKDSMISDLTKRMSCIETAIDTAPISETFTLKSTPGFLHGRIRRTYILHSQTSKTDRERNNATKRLSYKLVFHQYLGIAGLGISVTSVSSKGAYQPSHTEEILFLDSTTLSILSTSIAGSKERKLPDLLLKNLRVEKREFIKDWMRGYVNLRREDDEYYFDVEDQKCLEKTMWIEYVGMFDAMGTPISEPKFASQNGQVVGSVCGGCATEQVSTVDEMGVPTTVHACFG